MRKTFVKLYCCSNLIVCVWTFLILVGFIFQPSSVLAAVPSHSGYYTFYNTGGTIIIVGYDGPGGVVVIPATINDMPVVGIENWAFYNCAKLTSVIIPDSVASIGYEAFGDCTNLTSVNFGNSVKSIGLNSFSKCIRLTSIAIPNSVTSIGNGAFHNCGLTSVTIPDSVTSIEGSAFVFCSKLTSVTIGSGVMSIGNTAFADCTSLTKAAFYGNAPSMGSNVFGGCARNFSVCYTAESTGFTTPTWYGYPAAICEAPETTTTTTIPSWSCAVDFIYGENSEQAELLRAYRDKVLSKTPEGQELIKTYYKFSPTVTKLLEQRPLLKNKAKAFIESMLPGIREKVKQRSKCAP